MVQVEGIDLLPERPHTRRAGACPVAGEAVLDGEALGRASPHRCVDGSPHECLQSEQESHKTCSCAASLRLKTAYNKVELSDPSVVAEAPMISLQDLIAFCDLTPEEVQVVAEHEHVSQAAAAVLGNLLLQSQSGCERIRDMLMDEIRAAVRQHDAPHARQLVSTLRHFLHEHPNVALRDAA